MYTSDAFGSELFFNGDCPGSPIFVIGRVGIVVWGDDES